MASDWHEGGMAWHGMAWSGMAWHRLYYTYKEILNALNSKGRCKDVGTDMADYFYVGCAVRN